MICVLYFHSMVGKYISLCIVLNAVNADFTDRYFTKIVSSRLSVELFETL